MTTDSPFSQNRYEYEQKHFFFLPKKIFDNLERPIPVYLIGSRGSGKTTFLKSLNWHERLTNRSLKRQLKQEVFAGKYIGTYLKLPTIQLQTLETWLNKANSPVPGLLLGLYFDLVSVETIASAIAELLGDGHLKVSAETERQHVEGWVQECPFFTHGHSERPSTVKSFSQGVQSIRTDLETQALVNAEPSSVAARLKCGQIGSLGKALANKMGAFCDTIHPAEATRWHFKVCFDEGGVTAVPTRI
jgi:hypothetical protein